MSSRMSCAVGEEFVAHLALGHRGGEPGRGAVDEQAGDAAGTVVGRAHHHRVEVGAPAVGDPRLGAVDDVGVAVEHRSGGERRGVRAGVRLGEAVAAEQARRRPCRRASDRAARPCRTPRAGSRRGSARSRSRRWTSTRGPAPRGPAASPRTAAPLPRRRHRRAGPRTPSSPRARRASRGNSASASACAARGASSAAAKSSTRAMQLDGLLGGHQPGDGGALPRVPHHATTRSRGLLVGHDDAVGRRDRRCPRCGRRSCPRRRSRARC